MIHDKFPLMEILQTKNPENLRDIRFIIIFSHPDCTVGLGIAPSLPRGSWAYSKAIYHRLGLSPYPEDMENDIIFI